jgi:predicted nucleotidyltransferase
MGFKMNEIMQRLQEDYDTVVDLGYEIVYLGLQGSQNYNLQYDGSDIDTKAIVLPKFEDIILNKKPTSFTHILENNAHIDVKDIRLMFECFRKQNVNFVEIIFTKYKVINPKYEVLFQPILDNKELVAHYNNFASVNCMSGMAMEKYKALEHPYPATLHKIEKFGYCGKQLHHLIRLKEFITRYINGEKYEDCLISNQRDFLIRVKTNEEYSLEEARIIARETVNFMTNIKNEYMNTHKPIIDKRVEDLLNSVLVDIMKYNLKTELGCE